MGKKQVSHPFSRDYDALPLQSRASRLGHRIWRIQSTKRSELVAHYFVDEAGDGTLFNAGGRAILGENGCSNFFSLGLTWVYHPTALQRDLEELRRNLIADPYFRKIPSMQPTSNKTASFFHAKDDIPEVRREVFRVLRQHPSSFYAAVFDKHYVLENVRRRNAEDSSYRYHPNELYDALVTRIFTGRLHRDGGYEIHFAKRGQSDRTEALGKALSHAQEIFEKRWGIKSGAPINISPSTPVQVPCLQATDYYLWAVQRCFERGDDRYLEYIWPAVRLIQDCDDVRSKGYGENYTTDSVLTAKVLEGRKRRQI